MDAPTEEFAVNAADAAAATTTGEATHHASRTLTIRCPQVLCYDYPDVRSDQCSA